MAEPTTSPTPRHRDVAIVTALPAGTNAIGKLAANDGVDIGNVDVASLPGTVATDLTAIKTAVETLDNAITGNEMQVDVVAALPAGTNAIGKLAANSGVDIGDVDVKSIAAGENHLGAVGGHSAVLEVTLSLDTNIYADGDVLAEMQEVTGALRVAGGSGILQSLQVLDTDDQGEALDIVIMKASGSLGTENSAVSISDADADKILAVIECGASGFLDLINSQLVSKGNLGIVLDGPAGTSIWVGAISRGTGTYMASGITLKLGILQD